MEAYRQMLSFCHRRGTKKKVQRLSRAFVYHILRCSGEREGKGGWERKGREGGRGREGRVEEEGKGGWDGGRREEGGGGSEGG